MIRGIVIISFICFVLLTIKAEKPPCDSYECNTDDPTHWGALYAHVAIPSKFYECTPFGLELFDCPDGLIFPICAERCEFPDSTGTPPPTTTTTQTQTTTTEPTTPEQTTPEPTTPEPTTPEQTTPEPTTSGPADWIVIQRRGSPLEAGETRQNFYLEWVNYTNGFGDSNKDFWLGLEKISDLTKNGDYELNILMTSVEGTTHEVNYDTFKVSDSTDNYRLSIGGFHGNIFDAMARHNGQRFTTRDRDNDNYPDNCAVYYNAAWWYDDCFDANLNGVYVINNPLEHRSILWIDRNTVELTFMKFTEMKIRLRI
jgi:hypothetical protein